jgi:Carboxypeptidase regulatory-like domain
MLVEDPYGNVTRVEYYTDLFSPNVDFIGRFRFTGESELPVVPGLPYTFTLLDAFGRPIEGAVSTDTWNRCDQGAPADYVATPGDDYINLSWLAVDPVEGQFDPGNYQITMYPMEGQAGEYGSDGIQANYHHMPLNHFEPPGEGVPDGQDFGDGLLQLEDGPYEINVWAWNHADDTNGGWGSDCAVRDSSQSMIMRKQDSQFSFEVPGSISGNVSDAGGPLAGVHVDACTLDDNFCNGAETDQDGNYRILGLTEGHYRVFVWGGQGGWIDEFYQETPFHHEATPVHVINGNDTPDIDFTMEHGGSISGNVSDVNGPLEGVHVDACAWDDSFCFGAETGPDGNYTVYGLPAGDYRAFVWGGQGGWVSEYYQETPFHHEAMAVGVSVGSDTPGIDFSMEPGGSISGTVFDTEGNPLGGIGVDIESGGFGACTDENGYYNLEGLPLGTYDVVAGRDFCGPHPFAEQTQYDVETGSAEVNFYLEEMSYYQPALHVVPAYPEIHGHGWNPEAQVTIYVDDDDDLGNGFLYTESKFVNGEPTWCIAPCFDVSQVPELPDGVLPGFVVTMTDGEATRVVHTTELVWTGTDTEAETVFGTAGAGTWIEVRAHGPQEAMRMVQADGNGDWVADFSVPGPGEFEGDILNLEPGYHGRAVEFEYGVPDDGTLAYWSIDEPPQPEFTIIAQPDHEWVFSFGWGVGVEVTLYIDENNDPYDGSYLFSSTQTTFDNLDDPGIGYVNFSGWEPIDLAPDMFVIVTDGSVVETLQVESLSVDQWDETAVTVSGTAPPNREVGVGVHQPYGDFWQVVMSDANGDWSADFSAKGVDAPTVFDIHAMIWDQDGDATQANYGFP